MLHYNFREDQILPHVEETPSGQPTVPHAEIKRKHGAPEPTIEETPAVAPQAPPTRPVDTSDVCKEIWCKLWQWHSIRMHIGI